MPIKPLESTQFYEHNNKVHGRLNKKCKEILILSKTDISTSLVNGIFNSIGTAMSAWQIWSQHLHRYISGSLKIFYVQSSISFHFKILGEASIKRNIPWDWKAVHNKCVANVTLNHHKLRAFLPKYEV